MYEDIVPLECGHYDLPPKKTGGPCQREATTKVQQQIHPHAHSSKPSDAMFVHSLCLPQGSGVKSLGFVAGVFGPDEACIELFGCKLMGGLASLFGPKVPGMEDATGHTGTSTVSCGGLQQPCLPSQARGCRAHAT